MIGVRRKLPLTVPLQTGEPATSFVERLARRNGITVTRKLAVGALDKPVLLGLAGRDIVPLHTHNGAA